MGRHPKEVLQLFSCSTSCGGKRSCLKVSFKHLQWSESPLVSFTQSPQRLPCMFLLVCFTTPSHSELLPHRYLHFWGASFKLNSHFHNFPVKYTSDSNSHTPQLLCWYVSGKLGIVSTVHCSM